MDDQRRTGLDHPVDDPVHSGRVINLVWRPKVVQWYYDFVDGVSEDRCVVYVAVTILDRFCRSIDYDIDERTFELSALSALFLAVRIGGSVNLELDYLVSMSRLTISVPDLVHTGTRIINALKWEQKITTPHDFVRRYDTLLPRKGPLQDRLRILDTAIYIVEISLCDYCLSRCEPSELSAAAILIALGTSDRSIAQDFSEALYLSESIVAGSAAMTKIRSRLIDAYNNSTNGIPEDGPTMIEDDQEMEEPFTSAPHPNLFQPETTNDGIHIILPDL